MFFCICYNVCRHKQRYMLIHLALTTRKPPLRYCNISLGAFSWLYSLARLGCVAELLTIQPFADAVCNHTCRNGETQRYN